MRKKRILILGASDSGKSTILKQIKLLHSKKSLYTKDDLKRYRYVIRHNSVAFIRQILSMVELYGCKEFETGYEHDENELVANKIICTSIDDLLSGGESELEQLGMVS